MLGVYQVQGRGLSPHPKISGQTQWMGSKGKMRGPWLSLGIPSSTPSDQARSLSSVS